MSTDWERVGRASYEAYLESHGGLAARWEELSEGERKAWIASSTAAIREFLLNRLEPRGRRS